DDTTGTAYALEYLTGHLTIDPRSLLIVAQSQSSAYADPVPATSLSYLGLASFDTSAAIAGVTVTPPADFSDVGIHFYHVSGAFNPNYDIAQSDGQLTVTPRPVNVVMDDETREYGLANPGYSFHFENTVITAPQLNSIGSLGRSLDAQDDSSV